MPSLSSVSAAEDVFSEEPVDDVPALQERALECITKFDFEQGRKLLLEVLGKRPGNQQALQQLYAIDKQDPGSSRYHETAVSLLASYARTSPQKAYELYNKAYETDSTNVMALYLMASILDNSLHRSSDALVDYQRYIDALDRMPEQEERNNQVGSIRVIVEDRIIALKEELFFLDQKSALNFFKIKP